MAKNNKDFYATRSTAWWKVAIAMIGSCLSGVTFVSVPGMVDIAGFGYLQMVMGFFLGYLVIAFVLCPLYFKLNVVSVYEYLDKRFGMASHKTGAWFFFISKILGASARLFLVCATLQLLLMGPIGVPFWVTVLLSVLLVWLYTVRGGVKAVIGMDIFKTLCMLAAVGLTLFLVGKEVGKLDTGYMKLFHFDDVNASQYFWKQLLGGMFTVIAMTGLDQDMMQRTLACKNVRDSQKNLMVSILLQAVMISLFLFLGVALYQYAGLHGITARGDQLFPEVAWNGGLPKIVGVLFLVGLVMAGFPAGGSALTSLTTSFTIDILGGKDQKRTLIHSGMAVLMALAILVFNALNNTSVCKRTVKDRWVPVVAILAPILCLVLDMNSVKWFNGYHFSYELLLMNAAFTIVGLLLISKKK